MFQHEFYAQVAAQNCRKRKIDQIAMLERQVDQTRRRKTELIREREELVRQRYNG